MDPDKDIIDRWHSAEVLLLGGSAGSFKFLFQLVHMLPPDLGKSVIIVMHRKRNFLSEVEKLFSRNARMLLKEVDEKEKIKLNTIYIAPANYHTLIEKDRSFSLDASEALWYSKPSIDVTFESAADVYQDKCLAVLLSGANQDGALGLLRLRNAGSLTIAQHPDDAEMPEMPTAAVNIDAVDCLMTTEDLFNLFRI